MKATISELGCLRVTAETELESYALNAWWKGYEADNKTSTLLIELNVRAATTPEQPNG